MVKILKGVNWLDGVADKGAMFMPILVSTDLFLCYKIGVEFVGQYIKNVQRSVELIFIVIGEGIGCG